MKNPSLPTICALIAAILLYSLAPCAVSAQKEATAVFSVKYLSSDTVYINAGRNSGIKEGMQISVVDEQASAAQSEGARFRGAVHVAELKVISVADSSSVCEIVSTKGELKVGQIVFLTPESVQERRETQSAAEAADFPIVVGFTYGDPLDDEVRQAEEKKIIQESPVGRARGRLGFDVGGTNEAGGFTSKQLGMVINADMTYLGGTYWNFTGYWRGNLTSSRSGTSVTTPTTLTDLIDRTYHLSFTYDNPYSPTRIGVGRLFLPWAPSLSTIDGAYFARKISRTITAGIFGGSTPDPTSWSYNPDQRIAGAFVNYEKGDFNSSRYFLTAGIAATTIQWRVARQFAFFENTFSWKRYFSLFNSLQADEARTSPLPNGGSNPTGVTQSYTTVRFQPVARVSFGLNHNYFRNLPTFDPRLIGTGLLDQYLFQGFSGDVRVELPKRIAVYASLGKSKASTDQKGSLNQGYGINFGRLWFSALSADVHYSQFDSSFGKGHYESFSIIKSLNDSLRVQLMGGHQSFLSPLSTNTNSSFVNLSGDWNIGPRYFFETNYGWYHGTTMQYTQWSSVFGYRFGGFRK
jgi:hypothetical protein